MEIKNKKKNIISGVIIAVIVLFGFFSIYHIISASSLDNKIKVNYARINAIHTGTPDFDSKDNVDFSSIDDYEPGNDYSESDRIIRTFDTITYDIDFFLIGKDDSIDFDDRKVAITVNISEEEAKYVSFSSDSISGETSHTYIFDSIDSFDMFTRSITLYVLNGKNGSLINPSFTIKENTDNDTPITLGKVNDKNYYAFDNEYVETATFANYMPTVVSSKYKDLSAVLRGNENNQKAIYNDLNGRYLTYVLGFYVEGNVNNGIKGLNIPDNNIKFDLSFDHSGIENIVFDNNWGRLYGIENIGDIKPIVVDLPYSTKSSNSSIKEIKNPGSLSVSKIEDNYNITISDFKYVYDFVRVNADDSEISNSKAFIGTYAFTIFSPRISGDLSNDIVDTIYISNIKSNDLDELEHEIEDLQYSITNEYFRVDDNSLVTYFTSDSGVKLSSDTVEGSLSRGTSLYYKTEFDFKETNASNGLKEVIKINNNAFRVLSASDNDINISFTCNESECKNIKESDFEVKFVSGTFSKDNYSKAEIDNRISDLYKTNVTNTCNNLDLNTLSSDQIMNLYGGPCIVANNKAENIYSKIDDAIDKDGNEIPITKIIVQTKEGVKLPDNFKLVVETKLRIRNVQDMTRAYQATTVVSTSDYDKELSYFAPNIMDMTNANNYTLADISNTPTKTSLATYGDSLKISNYTSSQTITVLNNKSDGTMKTNYNTTDNETIIYNIDTRLEDNGVYVSLDDSLYINNIYVDVFVPNGLNYIEDADLDKYLVNVYPSITGTYLEYKLPFTKTNFAIPNIRFKAKLDSKITGPKNSLIVRSSVYATDINENRNNDIFGNLNSTFEIFATGINNVVVEEEIGEQGSLIDKNSDMSFILRAYNNTNERVTEYSLVDILPSNGDYNGSKFSGTYSVKLKVPTNNAGVKVLCSTQKYAELSNEIDNKNNVWKECNITEDYVSNITAIRIDNVTIEGNSYSGDFEVLLKTNNNNFSDTYYNGFIGGSTYYSTSTSNVLNVSVVNRTISGLAFIDNNEDGIRDNSDTLLSGIPVTLYKLDLEDKSRLVDETITDKNGYYEFENLEVGRFYIDFNYNGGLYDLTLRYASENETTDSDAYKVKSNEGLARISNTKNDITKEGIKLTSTIYNANNMDIGFIPRKTFGFEINKYITRIDVSYNGSLETLNFDNVPKATITVRDNQNATAKVYYGMKISNNGTVAGYVKEIEENIPEGLIFDPNYPENEGWVNVDGTVKYTGLSDILIKPGESKYIRVVLFMPSREEAGVFLNTVSIVSMEKYQPKEIAKEVNVIIDNKYSIGEEINYAGVDWHVINAVDNNGYQTLTLLADHSTIISDYQLTNSIYKWSESYAYSLLNGGWNGALNRSSLIDSVVCDDASGLQVNTYGGSLGRNCQSEMFVNSKVRLITIDEINRLTESNISDLSWLFGNRSFWTENAFKDDSYKAYYVDENGLIDVDNASNSHELRPVITISSNKILYE